MTSKPKNMQVCLANTHCVGK